MDGAIVSIVDFSDCVLLNLLRYLDSSSLFQLTKVNKRFESLILDTCLWRKIDARDEPNSKEKVEYCLDRVNKFTSMLCLRGETASIPLLTELQMDNFPEHLTVLALENQNIDQPIISLNNFPKTLVELSFKNSSIANSSYFFKRTFERMNNLKVLLLDGCSLINSSVVMSVSKYPNLEILSFYKCQIENSIPYFSIAAWHGFKKLKVLDVRLSGLGNPFLKSMIRCTNIVAFYFQNMDSSYIVDFKNRQNEVESEGKKGLVPQIEFTILRSSGNEDNLITDKGTSELKRTTQKNEISQASKSFLYTDPYGPCTCGFANIFKGDKWKESEEMKNPYVALDAGFCDSGNLRCQVKEYPANSDDEETNATILKRRLDPSQSKPPKKRKRLSDEPEASTSLPSSSKTCGSSRLQSTTPKINFERRCAGVAASRTGVSIRINPSILRERERARSIPSCSTSNTDTVERENGQKRNEGPECPVPTKKSDNGTNENETQVKSGESQKTLTQGRTDERPIPSSQCERKKDSPERGLDKSTVGDKEKQKSDEDGEKPMDLDKAENSLNFSINDVSSLLDPIIVPSTSGEPNRYDGEKPSTSQGTSRQTGSGNESSENRPEPTQTPPPAENGEVEIGVSLRNRMDAYNRSVIQICINAERERRHVVLPNVLRLGQREDFPIVLNAVRMINFMIPPDEQPNDHDIQVELRCFNGNMNKSYQVALKRLSFRGYNRVTDMTLGSIEHLNLELLDLTYTRTTKKGIFAFLRMNPNCRVLHKEFCVCKPKLHF